jgi:hypothetical protein
LFLPLRAEGLDGHLLAHLAGHQDDRHAWTVSPRIGQGGQLLLCVLGFGQHGVRLSASPQQLWQAGIACPK